MLLSDSRPTVPRRRTRAAVARKAAALLVTAALATALLALSGCTPKRDGNELFAPGDVDLLVVDARLLVGQALPEIRLSRTQAPGEPFTLEGAAVIDATVSVRVNESLVVDYRHFTGGFYVLDTILVPIVESETLYELEVTTPQGERLTAQTRTPPTYAVDSWVLLTTDGTQVDRELRTFAELGYGVYAAPENQLTYSVGIIEARFTVVDAPAYQLALFSLDLGSDFVIDPPFFEEEDFADLARNVSSPALAAENGTLRLPWLAVYFQGRHLYKIYAVDTNWYDLLRTSQLGDGGLAFGGNIGDDFERPIFHVEGGIGIFGSASVDSVGFNVLPLPGP